MTHTQLIWSLVLNGFTALAVLGSTAAFFLHGGIGNMLAKGKAAFRYFTVDSNVLCALVCLGVAVWDLGALRRGGGTVPRWLDLLKLMSAAAVGVTFFTVVLYLLPVTRFDWKLMYGGGNLFLHALCPLAGMLSWALVERGAPLSLGWALLGAVPTLLYGAVYLRMVLIRKSWEDFYYFNVGGKWYVSLVLMLLLSAAVALALLALRR